MKMQKLNQKQARWTLYLSRSDFMLKHVLDTKIGKANISQTSFSLYLHN